MDPTPSTASPPSTPPTPSTDPAPGPREGLSGDPMWPMDLVRVLGHDVAVLDVGSGDRAVVLVHGIGVPSRCFGPLVRTLAATTRVIVLDLPGFGRSGRPPAALSIEEHAAVVEALVARSGLVRPVLVGHSTGAQVVTEVAARNPGLAQRVVLIGPVAESLAPSALREAWLLVRDARRETAGANRIMVGDWLRSGPRRHLGRVPTQPGHRLEDRMGDVAEQVLLVRGELDPVSPPAYLQRLAALARDAAVVEVADEGHLAMYRRPEVVAELCRRAPR